MQMMTSMMSMAQGNPAPGQSPPSFGGFGAGDVQASPQYPFGMNMQSDPSSAGQMQETSVNTKKAADGSQPVSSKQEQSSDVQVKKKPKKARRQTTKRGKKESSLKCKEITTSELGAPTECKYWLSTC